MIITKTFVSEDIAPFVHRVNSYCDEQGRHPETDYISPDDIIDGKWKINKDIDPSISKK